MRSRHRSISPRQQRGLARIKIIVIVAVVAIAAMLAANRLATVIWHTHTPEIVAAEKDLAMIEAALHRYQKDNGRYPSQAQGLLALILRPGKAPLAKQWQTGGYIDRLPRDPWGHSYQYRFNENEAQFEVFSFGPDGPDGDGETVVRAEH